MPTPGRDPIGCGRAAPLSRRERRALTAIGRAVAAEDPGLASLLQGPVVIDDRGDRRVAAGVLTLGLLTMVGGALFLALSVVFVGVLLLIVCWVPMVWGRR
jgi:hypothetical protein